MIWNQVFLFYSELTSKIPFLVPCDMNQILGIAFNHMLPFLQVPKFEHFTHIDAALF